MKKIEKLLKEKERGTQTAFSKALGLTTPTALWKTLKRESHYGSTMMRYTAVYNDTYDTDYDYQELFSEVS